MENSIIEKKFKALKYIVRSYELYKGSKKSLLEQEIRSLKTKLSFEDHESLRNAFEDYINYLLNILANTQRVFVRIKQDSEIPDDIESLFDDK